MNSTGKRIFKILSITRRIRTMKNGRILRFFLIVEDKFGPAATSAVGMICCFMNHESYPIYVIFLNYCSLGVLFVGRNENTILYVCVYVQWSLFICWVTKACVLHTCRLPYGVISEFINSLGLIIFPWMSDGNGLMFTFRFMNMGKVNDRLLRLWLIFQSLGWFMMPPVSCSKLLLYF